MPGIPSRPVPPLLPMPAAPRPATIFRTLGISASGLTAQRVRMEVAANNIANAETTHAIDGQPYRRQVARLQAADAGGTSLIVPPLLPLASPTVNFGAHARDAAAVAADAPDETTPSGVVTNGVQVAGIDEDTTPGPLVYDPGHPDADAQGYVRYPNVRITDETIDLMDARRVYEANASVFQAAKAMLRHALDI